MGRAFATAYIIARANGHSGEIKSYKGLREVNYGDFANQPYSVYPEMSPEENANFVNPNGESLVGMQARVLDCIAGIAAENPDKTVLIVAHDGTINALRAACSGEHIGTADLTRNPHDYVAKFNFKDGTVKSFQNLT